MNTAGKWIAAAVVLALVAVPVVQRLKRGSNAKEAEIQVVSQQLISPTILASGNLTYQTEIRMVSEVMGRVKEIRVKEGDAVKRGDVLLRLDPATVAAEVAQLEAATQQSRLAIQRQQVQLATLEARMKRYEQLRQQAVIDTNSFEDMRSQRDLARVELDSSRQSLLQTEAQLKRSREQLAKTELRAPIDGRVTQLTIKVGETAVPSVTSIAGSDLMIIADTASRYAEVNVNETDVARVAIGQEARIVPAAFPDASWAGAVETVAVSPRQVVGQGKSYPVKIRLSDSAEQNFHTGMSARAEIITRQGEATRQVAVPVQAVRYEDSKEPNQLGKASVFVVKDGRVKQQFVETGLADDTYIAVTKGLQEGVDVVVGPARVLRFLHDGERVKPQLNAVEETPAGKGGDAAKAAAPATAT
jgi:HlyD family secretion protein